MRFFISPSNFGGEMRNLIFPFWIERFRCRITHSLNHIIPFILNFDLRNGILDLSVLQFRRTLSNITHHFEMAEATYSFHCAVEMWRG
jgi:hypothetical protein